MLVGVNYPWIDYGWDFGDPPEAWVNPQHVAKWREWSARATDEATSWVDADQLDAIGYINDKSNM